ncbi:sterile alpha motif domain-containing protein 15-like [Mizuhopecten yessoensis]|uniref:Sterile alpha motif domain-containing protein 15 n=1 Tax=Mizuhopecten yessoensis TaxID=6573 RepID=A0A210R5N8_MIZYE|nr:sterile alpha motif domain-containing protein 15-like [Mizuhopecten yessoensis]OWF56359.1 Sterile alpha motif domain-containing protein 15 [Mizuhopecten yessoensis]
MAAMTSTVEDLKNEQVPQCLYWTVDQVVDWIDNLGFPYYKACFATNMINGRKLVTIEAKALPSIGITDFEHIKIIAKSIRDMLNLEEPDWTRSISLPPRNDIGMYVERKSGTGKNIDSLTFNKFLQDFKDAKWRPPLANHCLILPRC